MDEDEKPWVYIADRKRKQKYKSQITSWPNFGLSCQLLLKVFWIVSLKRIKLIDLSAQVFICCGPVDLKRVVKAYFPRKAPRRQW